MLRVATTLALATAAAAALDWATVTSQSSMQTGEATFYGHQEGQDAAGACSYSENFANTNSLPWSTGISTTIALNDAQFEAGLACGMCIMYQGTGEGIGTTPLAGDRWYRGFVNNRCPECAKGDIDMNIAGDGRWKARWYAVPCNVGTSKLNYKIVTSSPYWFSMVVSNHAVPITGVQVKLGGAWRALKHTTNNQWAYYSEAGPWQSSFPLPVRVTSVTGETIEEAITSAAGGDGTKQFKETGGGAPGAGYPGKGVPPENLPNKGSVGAGAAGAAPKAAAPAGASSAAAQPVQVQSAAAGNRRLLLA